MRNASTPAIAKNTKAVTTKRIPISLWSVELIHPTRPGFRAQVRSKIRVSSSYSRRDTPSPLFQALEVIEERVHVGGRQRARGHENAGADRLGILDPARQML